MKYAMLVLKNLMRSKRRTILTIISIAVSLFIFSALVSLPTVANELLADSASSVRIAVHNKAGLTYALPESYKTRIAATPHVVAVMGESWFGGIYHEVSDSFPNLAVDPETAQALWTDWDISPQAFADFRKIRTAAMVGPETMKRFNLHVGQQIMLRGTIYPINVTLKIVGVTGGKAPPNILLFRRDYLEEAIGRPGFVIHLLGPCGQRGGGPRPDCQPRRAVRQFHRRNPKRIGSRVHEQLHGRLPGFLHDGRGAGSDRGDHHRAGGRQHRRDVDS